MIIKHVKLENWGPHEKLDLDMNSSIVGIIGQNGKGKSNLLHAIAYALTGQLPGGMKGVSFIRNFGTEAAPSKAVVSLTFEKDGKTGIIKREVLATGITKRELSWDSKKYKAAAEIDGLMSELLAADKAAVLNAVYIRQGDIAKLVRGTPSERQDVFLKLMNLTFIEPRINNIKKRISSINDTITDYTPIKEMLSSQLEEAESSLKDKKRIIEDNSRFADLLSWLMSLKDALNKLWDSSKKLDKIKSSLVKLKADLCAIKSTGKGLSMEEAEEKQELLIKEEAELCSKLQRLSEFYSNMEEIKSLDKDIILKEEEVKVLNDSVKLKSNLYSFLEDTYSSKNTFLETLLKKEEYYITYITLYQNKQKLESSLQALLVSDEENKKLLELKNSLDDISKKINMGELVEGNICPICGSTLDENFVNNSIKELSNNKNIFDHISSEYESLSKVIRYKEFGYNATKDNLSEIESKINSLDHEYLSTIDKDIQQKVIDLKEEITNIQKEKEKIQKELETLNSHLKSVSGDLIISKNTRSKLVDININMLKTIKSDINTDDKDDIRKLLIEQIESKSKERKIYSSYLKSLKEVQAAITAYEESSSMEEINYNKYKSEVNRLHSICPDKEYSTELEYEVDKLIQTVKVHVDAYSSARTEYEIIKNTIDKDIKVKLADVSKKELLNKNKINTVNDLKCVLDIVSRQGVPMLYAKEVFALMTKEVQALLGMMQANFSVVIDMDTPLTYKFVRNDSDTCYEMPQDKLSGGQAIRLSIALLLACQKLLLPEVGLLILDEPSSHIDSEGVAHMRDMFLHLEKRLDSRKMQIIIVDHNSILATAFEKTIEL